MLPEAPRARLRWAVQESLVILGVFLFWVVVVGAVTVVAALLALPYQLLGGWVFRPLAELARSTVGLWGAVIPLTVVSTSIYVVVRAGGLLIDHYHDLEASSGPSAP